MIGAIAGDIIGSVYKHRPIKTKDFPLFDARCDFTDDTVLSVAMTDAILAFLESQSYEDAVRNAISLGGDSDTPACITARIAEAVYGGVPDWIRAKVKELLTPDLWAVTETFCRKYEEEVEQPGAPLALPRAVRQAAAMGFARGMIPSGSFGAFG